MRALLLLSLLATTTIAAPRDLRPRYGSGWTGFAVGSSVRMKMTAAVPKRVPFVQITTTTLKKVEKNRLTLESVTENQLTDPQKRSSTVPPAGEAGVGETETSKKLPDEKIKAAGRDWECTKRQITITGAAGKRVITDWIAKDPLLRVKREEKRYDKTGKLTGTTSTVLSKPAQKADIGGRVVLAFAYRSVTKSGDDEQRSETWTSRQVPGDLVSGEIKFYKKGKLIQTLTLKALKFVTK